MLSRRNLIAAVIVAGPAVTFGQWPSLAVGGSLSRYRKLAALCAGLGCPYRIGRACFRALPEVERSAPYLASTVLEQAASTGSGCTSLEALRRYVREKSRIDFTDGKIVAVDGWILSLTEVRLYALAALLAGGAEGGFDGTPLRSKICVWRWMSS